MVIDPSRVMELLTLVIDPGRVMEFTLFIEVTLGMGVSSIMKGTGGENKGVDLRVSPRVVPPFSPSVLRNGLLEMLVHALSSAF